MIKFSLFYGKSRGKLPESNIIKGNDASLVSFLWSGSLLFPAVLNLGAVTERRIWVYARLLVSSEMGGYWDPFINELFLTGQSGVSNS